MFSLLLEVIICEGLMLLKREKMRMERSDKTVRCMSKTKRTNF